MAKEYPRPAVTVDLVVYASVGWQMWKLLTVTRKNEPFKGKLALPGGFVDPGETTRAAAWRELEEETGLNASLAEHGPSLIDVFSKPGRDPRGWTISVAYGVIWPAERMHEIKAGDDAAKVQWIDADLSKGLGQLAFDHADIVRAWWENSSRMI